MAEEQKTEQKIHQVIQDSDPQGTPDQLRALGMNLAAYGSCAPKRDAYAIPAEERVKGCQVYPECTLEKIKGVAGPINVPYRLYKQGGKIREGWGPCFTVMRMLGQYNRNDGYIMEILPLGTKVGVPGSKPIKRSDGLGQGPATEIWEDFIDEQTVPPFPKIGDRGHLLMEKQADKVRKDILKKRQDAFVERSLGITPDDVEAAQKTPEPGRTGKAG